MYIYVDEVGMASISGPVITCAVAIKPDAPKIQGVNDSKKISKKKREKLYIELKDKIIHSFGAANIKRVEELNVFWARHEAMKEAINKLIKQGVVPDRIIIDGKFKVPDIEFPQEAIIKADAKFWQMGAASILAKVTRDNMMANLAKLEKFSYYDWGNNAGYYTEKHKLGIMFNGISQLHRENFYYTKYCLFEHMEFKRSKKSKQEYLEEIIKDELNNDKSRYVRWKNGVYNSWKPVIWGE